MQHNGIQSFSTYFEYVNLITILPEEEQAYLYLKMMNFIFFDVEPTNLTPNQSKIWVNLVRPISKSKTQALNGLKKWQNNANKNANEDANQDTKQDTKLDTNLNTKKDTKQDTQSKMYMYMSNVNCNMSNLDIYKQVIEYLNTKAKTKFKYTSKATQSKINARLNEGYKLDDFIAVIDKKTDEWLDNEEFSKYLCPETLFGTKFEKYYNQKPNQKNTKPEWMDKKIEREKLSKEEEQEVKELMKEFS